MSEQERYVVEFDYPTISSAVIIRCFEIAKRWLKSSSYEENRENGKRMIQFKAYTQYDFFAGAVENLLGNEGLEFKDLGEGVYRLTKRQRQV